LSVYSARLRRYKTSNERKIQNRLFQNNEKLFYQRLNNTNEITIIPPTPEEIKTFWSGIWSQPKQHKDNAEWIIREENIQNDLQEQTDHEVTMDELITIIKKNT
jgi:hypothetical protein